MMTKNSGLRFLDRNQLVQFLDHFHPPLSTVRHWESFHARWASAIADVLNDALLPTEYFAEVQVHVGSRVEVDVGTFAAVSSLVLHTHGKHSVRQRRPRRHAPGPRSHQV